MGTTQGACTRYRSGRPWPEKCGPGKWQHIKGCHPRRPKCRWRKWRHELWKTCTCGTPHYPHRIKSVDWKNGGACIHHPEHDRIMHEMMTLTDWDDGEQLEPSEICAARYLPF